MIAGLLLAGWVLVLGQPNAFSVRLRSLFAQLGTPFVKLADLIPAVHSRRELDRQNRELRTENDSLRQQVRAFTETGRENLRLRELLKLTGPRQRKTIAARVIGRDSANWWQSLQLDRGWDDGLTENMTVLNADGLIGRTVAVTRGESRVLLLLDSGCKVSALLQDSREPGIVAGGPKLTMSYLNRAATVKPGEAVITSGLGGVYPKGILLGHVEQAGLNPETGMYLDATIKPAVDFRHLEEVLVILE